MKNFSLLTVILLLAVLGVGCTAKQTTTSPPPVSQQSIPVPVATPTPTPSPSKPAIFRTSDLTIAPSEANSGSLVTIRVTVTNTGELSGAYDVNLKIDDSVEDTQAVVLAGGASQNVTFSKWEFTAKTYSVTIGEQSGTFVVKSPPPPPPTNPAPPTTTPPTTEPTKIAPGVSAPPFPGNTIADLTLQKDIWLFIRLYEVAAGNQSPTVVKTEITQALTADGAWAETWTIESRGIAVNYDIKLRRDPTGGTIFSVSRAKTP